MAEGPPQNYLGPLRPFDPQGASQNRAGSSATGPEGPVARSDKGSVLVLMPAAALIFLVLGALAVDSAAVFLAQRQLANAAVAAANDAAVAAVDVDRYYADGSVRLLAVEAQRVTDASVESLGPSALIDVHPVATVSGSVVQVTITARARHIFSGAVPGGPDTADVAATAVAHAVRP